jgi:hypothetical protein
MYPSGNAGGGAALAADASKRPASARSAARGEDRRLVMFMRILGK